MALFQKSVIKKYLKELNSEAVQQSWQLFKAHFQNPTIQQDIRDSKEEEYQEGFVRDLFVTVPGYIFKPQPHFNFVWLRRLIRSPAQLYQALVPSLLFYPELLPEFLQ